MGLPAEHTALLQRKGFPIPAGCPLTDQERDLLARYGYWLEALAAGTLAPVTPEQERFVRSVHGATPVSPFEVAWAKCRAAAAPAAPSAGPLELHELFTQLVETRAFVAASRAEHEARRAAILQQVQAQLDALDAEYAERFAEGDAAAAELEREVRAAVLALGASFRHPAVHAVYTAQRITWDGKGLARYAQAHPEIEQFRRIGGPTVSLRFSPPPGAAPPEE